jgi:hypothetical protein
VKRRTAEYSLLPKRFTFNGWILAGRVLVWSVSFVWLNETNQMNQINQINKTNQIVYRMAVGVDSCWSGAGLGWIWLLGMMAVAVQILFSSSIWRSTIFTP